VIPSDTDLSALTAHGPPLDHRTPPPHCFGGPPAIFGGITVLIAKVAVSEKKSSATSYIGLCFKNFVLVFFLLRYHTAITLLIRGQVMNVRGGE
jgi:hypothetical protein